MIENKYPNGVFDSEEDLAEVKRLLLEVDAMEEVLAEKETAEARKDRYIKGIEKYKKPAEGSFRPNPNADDTKSFLSPGDQFVQSQEYKQLKGDGV
ncbi:MAG: hypothetical protein ACYSW6_11670, partial [Planctomycetota bacterium]